MAKWVSALAMLRGPFHSSQWVSWSVSGSASTTSWTSADNSSEVLTGPGELVHAICTRVVGPPL
jgi:hypothetical protein